jgi:uncharacterized protein YceH (UPF0502 family)
VEDPDAIELRVLGCLVEKQRTTPDGYPLTLNALRLAANQSTNRDPVSDYDEETVRAAAQRLGRRGWVRFASGAGSRTAKYRQIFDEALGLDGGEIAMLAVLMLRGEQTPGELNQRAARLHAFGSLGDVIETLERLAARDLVERRPRRPGQKEDRYRQILGGGGETTAPATVEAAAGGFDGPVATDPAAPRASAAWVPITQIGHPDADPSNAPASPELSMRPASTDLADRVEALETEVAELRGQLAELRASLGD